MSTDLVATIYCNCKNALTCSKCGTPMPTREDTKVVMNSLNERPANANVFGNGPLVVSDIPKSCRQKESVIVGVDEAGRGCVLGPMVYGAAYWSAEHSQKNMNIPKGFNDSKQLSDDTRRKLYQQILDHDDIGFVMRAFSAGEISRNMLRTEPYNLNQMSHDATFCMIRKLLDGGLNIQTCYIDTVGIAAHYQRKLEQEFPGVQFVVESKADAKYAPCSAASVVAKVARDNMLEGWKFSEPGIHDFSREYGSGYPSDPKCKTWMETLHDPVFGYNDFVRFSWAPAKKKVKEQGVPVTFLADIDEDEQMQQLGLSEFLGGDDTKKRKRLGYFKKRNLQVVNKLLKV